MFESHLVRVLDAPLTKKVTKKDITAHNTCTGTRSLTIVNYCCNVNQSQERFAFSTMRLLALFCVHLLAVCLDISPSVQALIPNLENRVLEARSIRAFTPNAENQRRDFCFVLWGRPFSPRTQIAGAKKEIDDDSSRDNASFKDRCMEWYKQQTGVPKNRRRRSCRCLVWSWLT
jgi:hypothetical protein